MALSEIGSLSKMRPIPKRYHVVRALVLLSLVVTVGCNSETESPTPDGWLVEVSRNPVSDDLVMALDSLMYSNGPSLEYLDIAALRSGSLERAVSTTGGGAITAAASRRRIKPFHPMPERVLATPYWPSIYSDIGAIAGSRVFAASNLFYPIYVFDHGGVVVDSLPTPPKSWKQAPPPNQGDFASESGDAWTTYLRNHTFIIGMAALSDSVLLVNHGHKRGHGVGLESLMPLPTTVDVYANGRRVVSDAPSPGEMVAYGFDRVFFLDRNPAGESEIVELEWAPGL
jgi:hypothetical protein